MFINTVAVCAILYNACMCAELAAPDVKRSAYAGR